MNGEMHDMLGPTALMCFLRNTCFYVMTITINEAIFFAFHPKI